ncbi:ankyrin repeat-containing domain protein [Xylariales sp. AK1849]|nr:ankyrin repeat-containing domain protein [Xylariales sp. AK1849]
MPAQTRSMLKRGGLDALHGNTKRSCRVETGGKVPNMMNTQSPTSPKGVATTAGTRQKLSDDVFWHLARFFLDMPSDVFHLALCSRRLWNVLDFELYRTHVQWTEVSFHRMIRPTFEGKRCDWTPPSPHRNGVDIDGSNFYESYRCRFPGEASTGWKELLQLEGIETALHRAGSTGNVMMAKKGIDAAKTFWPGYLNLEDAMGFSPLVLAIRGGHREIVQLLIDEEYCDVHSPSNYACWSPRPLHEVINHVAAPSLHTHPARGYNLGRRRPDTFMIPEGDMGQPLFILDPLGFAILSDHEDIAVLLLSRYHQILEQVPSEFIVDDTVDVKCFSRHGSRRSSRSEEYMDSFVYMYVNGHQPSDYWDKDRRLVDDLHLAALAGMTSIAEALILHSDPLESANSPSYHFHDCTPLHMAMMRPGTGGVIRVLEKYGAQTLDMDDQGRSAIQYALDFKQPSHVKWRISARDPVDCWNLGIARRNAVYFTQPRCPMKACMEDDLFFESTKVILDNLSDPIWDSCKKPAMEVVKFCVQAALRHGKNNHKTLDFIIRKGIGLMPFTDAEILQLGPDGAAHKDSGAAAIHRAANSKNLPIELFELLLTTRSKEVDLINLATGDGRYPLDFALQGKNTRQDIVLALLEHGAETQLISGEARRKLNRIIRESTEQKVSTWESRGWTECGLETPEGVRYGRMYDGDD